MGALHILLVYVSANDLRENNENSNCDYYFTEIPNEILTNSFLFFMYSHFFVSSTLNLKFKFSFRFVI